jgi:hypothetical protein
MHGEGFSEHLKMKKQKPKAIKLIGNLRIRHENIEKSQKRAQNVLLANQMRARQVANQYQLEIQRADSALHYAQPGLQRDALLMNRGLLQKKYDHIKL